MHLGINNFSCIHEHMRLINPLQKYVYIPVHVTAFKNTDKSNWILKCFETLTISIKKFKVCLHKPMSGFCHLLRLACNVHCLPDRRALQSHPWVAFWNLLRTSCDVCCLYNSINFNNMVYIYQVPVFKYYWYRWCYTLPSLFKQCYI